MNVSLHKCLKNHIVAISRTAATCWLDHTLEQPTDSEAAQEAKQDVKAIVIESRASFSSQDSYSDALCPNQCAYDALFHLRLQLEAHVQSQTLATPNKSASFLPQLRMNSTWSQSVVSVFQGYAQECFQKILPLVETVDHAHMITAFKYLCRDISNLARAYHIVQIDWHSNNRQVAQSLDEQRARLWIFCEALLVQLLDHYMMASEQASATLSDPDADDEVSTINQEQSVPNFSMSTLQGWNNLAQLSRWIQRVGQEFVPDHSSIMLEDKLDGLFQSCVLQPCHDAAVQEVQTMLAKETWALEPVELEVLLRRATEEVHVQSGFVTMPPLEAVEDGVFLFFFKMGNPFDDDFCYHQQVKADAADQVIAAPTVDEIDITGELSV